MEQLEDELFSSDSVYFEVIFETLVSQSFRVCFFFLAGLEFQISFWSVRPGLTAVCLIFILSPVLRKLKV